MEQIIALDIGETRTGIAKADIEGILVKAYKTIPTENIIQEIQEIEKDFEIKTIVIGLPLNIDGSDNEQSRKIRAEAEKLEQFGNKELVFEDEKLSSGEAVERLKARGITIKQDNKSLIDAEAAAIILEQYFGQG